jgi:hypothetical protein
LEEAKKRGSAFKERPAANLWIKQVMGAEMEELTQ